MVHSLGTVLWRWQLWWVASQGTCPLKILILCGVAAKSVPECQLGSHIEFANLAGPLVSFKFNLISLLLAIAMLGQEVVNC